MREYGGQGGGGAGRPPGGAGGRGDGGGAGGGETATVVAVAWVAVAGYGRRWSSSGTGGSAEAVAVHSADVQPAHATERTEVATASAMLGQTIVALHAAVSAEKDGDRHLPVAGREETVRVREGEKGRILAGGYGTGKGRGGRARVGGCGVGWGGGGGARARARVCPLAASTRGTYRADVPTHGDREAAGEARVERRGEASCRLVARLAAIPPKQRRPRPRRRAGSTAAARAARRGRRRERRRRGGARVAQAAPAAAAPAGTGSCAVRLAASWAGAAGGGIDGGGEAVAAGGGHWGGGVPGEMETAGTAAARPAAGCRRGGCWGGGAAEAERREAAVGRGRRRWWRGRRRRHWWERGRAVGPQVPPAAARAAGVCRSEVEAGEVVGAELGVVLEEVAAVLARAAAEVDRLPRRHVRPHRQVGAEPGSGVGWRRWDLAVAGSVVARGVAAVDAAVAAVHRVATQMAQLPTSCAGRRPLGAISDWPGTGRHLVARRRRCGTCQNEPGEHHGSRGQRRAVVSGRRRARHCRLR